MHPHDSILYNPDIARVFYLAGYIERWGRGVEKICDACKKLGAEQPEYELLGNGLRIRFSALKEALIEDSKAQNLQNAKISKHSKVAKKKWRKKVAKKK